MIYYCVRTCIVVDTVTTTMVSSRHISISYLDIYHDNTIAVRCTAEYIYNQYSAGCQQTVLLSAVCLCLLVSGEVCGGLLCSVVVYGSSINSSLQQ